MKRLVGEEVHAPVYGVLQLVFEVDEVEEALSPLELDQDVDVALLVHLAPDDGAEEGRSFDPILSQDLNYRHTHGLNLIAHKMPYGLILYSCPFYPFGEFRGRREDSGGFIVFSVWRYAKPQVEN